MYEGFHTAEDVMRGYLIQGSNLDEYGVPDLYPINVSHMDDTIDFSESFNCRIKNHRKINDGMMAKKIGRFYSPYLHYFVFINFVND